MKNREPRKATFIQARILTDAGWRDGIVRNVSSRGAMIEVGGAAPRRGSYIELRRATSVLVGQVMWAATGRFGISTREVIDIGALETGRATATSIDSGERRRLPRRLPANGDSTLGFRRNFEAAVLVAAIAFASITLATTLYRHLAHTSEQIVTASSQSSR